MGDGIQDTFDEIRSHMSFLRRTIYNLKSENRQIKTLLKIAKCPQKGCIDGQIDGVPCMFCDYRKMYLESEVK